MMGGMKDGGGQQSRFKWMMEGHSPAPSPPDTAHHKNGEALPWSPVEMRHCHNSLKSFNKMLLVSCFGASSIPVTIIIWSHATPNIELMGNSGPL